MMHFLYMALGVALLTGGGEFLIRGSLAAAKRLKISPLLTGLVIVGFGTSAPELAVSVDAALNQQPEISLGNVVGSNIGNILLILGLCALITPLVVRPLALRRDALTVLIATLLFQFLAYDGSLAQTDASILLTAFIAYLVWAYKTEKSGSTPEAELHQAEANELEVIPKSIVWICGSVLFGLVLLIGGSKVLLLGAVGLAKSMGISEAVIGLTIVAVGTSLPEMSVSVIAALRKHADVAVGNILGSNIFNILGILGISALLQPLPLAKRMVQFDQWFLLGTSCIILIFLFTGRRLNRLEGATLLVAYATYVWVSFSNF